jgi:chemotaxis protein MotB
MPRKKRASKEDSNSEAWLATYADTITLLLTFFVLLYSISSTDAAKLKGIANAMQGQLTGEGVMGGGTSNKTGDKDPSIIEDIPNQDKTTEEIKKEIIATIDEGNLEKSLTIREDERGIILGLNENIFFDLGSGELKSDSRPVLQELAGILTKIPSHIVIEGHTDNIPIKSSKYGSNWELSTQRAVSVVRFFVEQKGMSPTQFSATGYGEYKPLVDNNTPENRAKNRRVDIVITTE